ncbi:MAG: hypothetical protein KIT84_19665 [Labilithrix sp.]|nr:hypothetical protein [Labilithrix sp.]MCW5813255.1 hypothetical protein [Labilithrix sp.]
MMSMAPILMHSDHVSPSARQALRAASSARPEHRDALLVTAARILHAETGLPCEDVKELVGLPTGDC